MKTNEALEAEVIDFQEVVQAKAAGSGGGFDHFPGMTIGSKFLAMDNGNSGSLCDEYILHMKLGVSVLLWHEEEERYERHLGQKFWKLRTLVQILHDPEKDNNNGNRVPD